MEEKLYRPIRIKKNFIAILVFVLAACGGGGGNDPGTPGSSGSDKTFGKIVISQARHLGAVDRDYGDVWSVDAWQGICKYDEQSGQADYEPFSSDHLILTLFVEALYEDLPPANMTITDYEVEFFPHDEYSSPPLQSFVSASTLVIPADGSEVEGSFLVIPIDWKTKFAQLIDSDQIIPASFPVLYDMRVTFHGQDDYGNDFQFVYQTVIEMANYDNCRNN